MKELSKEIILSLLDKEVQKISKRDMILIQEECFMTGFNDNISLYFSRQEDVDGIIENPELSAPDTFKTFWSNKKTEDNLETIEKKYNYSVKVIFDGYIDYKTFILTKEEFFDVLSKVSFKDKELAKIEKDNCVNKCESILDAMI